MCFLSHSDTIGSVAFNPLDASLLTVSGSRHFTSSSSLSPSSRTAEEEEKEGDPGHNTDLDSDAGPGSEAPSDHDESSSDSSSEEHHCIRRSRYPLRPFTKDASAKIWKFPSLSNDSQAAPEFS